MALAPVETMNHLEMVEYIETLESENQELRAATDNTKKLDPREVKNIRRMWESGTWSQRELADAFDVNPATVSRTVRGIYHAA